MVPCWPILMAFCLFSPISNQRQKSIQRAPMTPHQNNAYIYVLEHIIFVTVWGACNCTYVLISFVLFA
jgi:hypothetical protein